MSPWDHGPNLNEEKEDLAAAAQSARLGLRLFLVYLALYGAFVLVNAFAPELMEATPVAGLNLAVLSGMGLILAAFVLAGLYGWLRRDRPNDGVGR